MSEDFCSLVNGLIRRHKEDEELEYRERIDVATYAERLALARIIAAFANVRGGHVLVGVGSRGEVTGIDPSSLDTERIMKTAMEYIVPSVLVEVRVGECMGKTLGLLTVKKSPTPCMVFDGRVPYRQGSRVEWSGSRVLVERIAVRQRAMRTLIGTLALLITFTALMAAFLPASSPDPLATLADMVVLVTTLMAAISSALVALKSEMAARIRSLSRFGRYVSSVGLPAMGILILAIEFWVLISVFYLNAGMLLIVGAMNVLVYVVLGALRLLPTNKEFQWTGLLLIVALVGIGVIYLPGSDAMSGIAVEISGVFVGILGAVSASEFWKAFEERRSSRNLQTTITDELQAIQSEMVGGVTARISWPIWTSIVSSGSLLMLARNFIAKAKAAYAAVEAYSQQPSPENKEYAMLAIRAILGGGQQ